MVSNNNANKAKLIVLTWLCLYNQSIGYKPNKNYCELAFS